MHRLRDCYTEILQQKQNEIKEPEDKCYHIELYDATKREVDLFKLLKFLSDKCNQIVED